MATKDASGGLKAKGKIKTEAREKRLAAALRENLKKRREAAKPKTPGNPEAKNKGETATANARAWVILVAVLAVHVFDEAVTGFLPFYNQIASSLKKEWGFFPMFIFPSTEAWLGALIALIAILFALTGRVARGGRAIRVFVTIVAALMAGNGFAHLFGSLYFGYPIPGFWSAWLILPAGLWVVYLGIKGDWRRTSR